MHKNETWSNLKNIGKEKSQSKYDQFSKKEIYKPCCIAILSTQVYAHTICRTVSVNHKRGKIIEKQNRIKKLKIIII